MFARPRFLTKKPSDGSISGEGSIHVSYEAGDAVSGHKIVRSQADGTVIHADHDDINLANDHLLGVSSNAAAAGDPVAVVTYGPLEELSWTWDTTKLLFLGSNGAIVQVQPVTGFSAQIGFPLTTTKIFVSLQRPILLA